MLNSLLTQRLCICRKMSKQIVLAAISILLMVLETNCKPKVPCNKMRIGDLWYKKEFIWLRVGRPYNLNVHKTSNTLFFGYSLPETYEDMDFQLAYYNLDSKDSQVIAGIRGGCAVAIDQQNDEIFLGGTDGIYTYNMLTKLADFYGEKGKNIWSLFFRKNLFYINYPEQKLHIKIDGRFVRVREFENIEVDHFHVSATNDIYYANKSGLFKIDNINMQVTCLNELISIRQITEDFEGNVYFCTNMGVYVDTKYEGLKKMISKKNIFGMAFDRDNVMIMSDDKSVYRLIPSESDCVEESGKLW